jgi:hypothetical protein
LLWVEDPQRVMLVNIRGKRNEANDIYVSHFIIAQVTEFYCLS